jgi:hypothetical protein
MFARRSSQPVDVLTAMRLRHIPRSLMFSAIVLIVLLAVLVLPISIPSNIDALGRIVPSKEWYLFHDRAGRITTIVNDRLTNSTTSLLVQQFERQDAVRFDLHPGVDRNGTVQCGDTIGILTSAEAEVQLAQLQGELSTADAKLLVFETGEKNAVVQEAENRVALAKQRYDGHLRTLERMKALQQRGVISAQEYEAVENSSAIYKADIEVARAQQRSAETGAKPAQLLVGRSDRSSVLGQIRALRQKIDRGILTAPFTGTVLRSALSDTLFHFGDTQCLAVIFSVPWSDRSSLHEGQKVSLNVATVAGKPAAVIRSIGNTVHSVRGEQVVLVTAIVEQGGANLLPGVITRCSIARPSQSLRSTVLSYLASVFGR